MKIIFLEVSQNFGGAQKSTIELAKRLKVLGHQVLIVDLWGCSKSFISAVRTAELKLNILSHREEPFIIDHSSKIKLLKNIILYFFLERKYKRIFAKLADDFLPDIVVTHNIKALSLLNPKARYKIDFFARGWFDYRSISSFSKKRIRKYNPRFLAVSQATRQALFSGGIAKLENIKVLTSVIESKVFDAYQPNCNGVGTTKPINILFSGGFLNTKGQHSCIAIAKKLRQESIPFKMTLTGIIYKGGTSEEYYYHILKLISENNLEDSVEIALNPPNIMDYFRNTDVLIHPSHTEGLPRVGLEALAFGKPVIANPVGGITDIVIHNLTGFITDFNAEEQYVEYIKQYIENPEIYALHSRAARQLIKQNYLDNNQFENIKKIYPI
ncbi:glycosyltransferase family 4 protein [Capnocytophaga felis]|nr:glycosyltransferase family 4 protein [Capnocytophaga felis]